MNETEYFGYSGLNDATPREPTIFVKHAKPGTPRVVYIYFHPAPFSARAKHPKQVSLYLLPQTRPSASLSDLKEVKAPFAQSIGRARSNGKECDNKISCDRSTFRGKIAFQQRCLYYK